MLKRASDSKVTNTYLIRPPQTNTYGTAFGGQIMSWMDETAAISALRYCNNNCVTVSVDQVQFTKPILMGHILIMKAKVSYAGTTSVEVKVNITSENPLTGDKQHCLTGYLTFVAVDENGKPTKVPGFDYDTGRERDEYELAEKRYKIRLENRA